MVRPRELGRAGDSQLFALQAPPGALVPLVQEVYEEVRPGETEGLLERVRRLPRPYQQVLEVARVGNTTRVTLERFVGVRGTEVILQLRAVDRLLPLEAWGALARTWLGVVGAQQDGVSAPENVGVDLQGRLVFSAHRFDFAVGELYLRAHPYVGGYHPLTVSPEEVLGHPLSEASRVYSVAASLTQLLTGEALFAGSKMEQLMQLARSGPSWTPRRHPEVGERLATVLTRALAHQPDARFPTLQAFSQALVAVLPPPASFADAVAGLCATYFRRAIDALTDPLVLPQAWRAGGLSVLEDQLLERALPLHAFPVPTCAPLR